MFPESHHLVVLSCHHPVSNGKKEKAKLRLVEKGTSSTDISYIFLLQLGEMRKYWHVTNVI